MKKLYQRTFEQVLAQTCPPLNRVEEQRRALASRCSHTESEVTAMTTKPRRPIRILVAAAAVAAALTAGALAASGVLGRIPLLTGGIMEQGVNEDGTGYASVSVSSPEESSPVEVRDGKAWFTTETGEELAITGQFSETEPYVYSYADESGTTHDIVVGGTLEDFGYFEYLYDEGGDFIGSTGYLPPSMADAEDWPAWKTAYEAGRDILTPSGGQSSEGELIWLEPALTVLDGKTLLTVDGETTDIIGRFSESEAYVCTAQGADGLTHVILVGGPADAPHTAEIIVEPDGQWTCSTDAPEGSAWLTDYLETLK